MAHEIPVGPVFYEGKNRPLVVIVNDDNTYSFIIGVMGECGAAIDFDDHGTIRNLLVTLALIAIAPQKQASTDGE